MSTTPRRRVLVAAIGSPCPYCGEAMAFPTGRPAATTSSLDRKGMRSPETSPWSAAAATPTRALYRWANGLPVCRELATPAPIMWRRSLSVVQPLRPSLGHQMAPNWGLFSVCDTGQLRARQ